MATKLELTFQQVLTDELIEELAALCGNTQVPYLTLVKMAQLVILRAHDDDGR
jgi:hypothetical protein